MRLVPESSAHTAVRSIGLLVVLPGQRETVRRCHRKPSPDSARGPHRTVPRIRSPLSGQTGRYHRVRPRYWLVGRRNSRYLAPPETPPSSGVVPRAENNSFAIPHKSIRSKMEGATQGSNRPSFGTGDGRPAQFVVTLDGLRRTDTHRDQPDSNRDSHQSGPEAGGVHRRLPYPPRSDS